MTRDDWILLGLGSAGALALMALDEQPAAASSLPSSLPTIEPTPRPHHEDQPSFDQLDEMTALARVIASEAGSRRKYTDAERVAIGWAVRNRARLRRVSIARMVCKPMCGKCCGVRPFSSAQTPSKDDLRIAAVILAAPQEDDPTFGAAAILEPAEQDRLVAEGRPDYKSGAAKTRENWIKNGQRHICTVGRWELWTA
jgi:hypothetical protein